MRFRRVIDVVAGVVLVTVASAGYHRVFDGWAFLVRFGAAAVLGAALVALLTRGLLPRAWAVGALVIALLPVEMYLALADTLTAGLPTLDTLSALWEGFTEGWANALDDFLPLVDPSPVTVLLVALVYAASVITTVLILHTDRVVPVVVPALALYATSLPLAAPAPESSFALVACLIAAALLMIVLRANPGSARSRTGVVRADADFQPQRRLTRIALIGGPMIAAAVLVGVGVTTVSGFGRTDDPFDPRDQRSDQVQPNSVVNPLDDFKTVVAQEPPVLAFELSLLGGGDLSTIERVKLAVLDHYDGRVWTSTDRYQRYDEMLPADPLLAEGERLTLSFDRISSDLGIYLPVVGRPVQLVDQSPVRFGPASGTVLAPSTGVAQPLTAVSDIVPIDNQPPLPESDTAFDGQRSLPEGMSDAIPQLTAEIIDVNDSPGDQLDALRSYLETETRFDADAPSGHSAGQIEAFLAGEQAGNAVHYATALAIMARTAGFPSRVVVGWDVPETPDGITTVEVTSATYGAWPEVRLAGGIGWQSLTLAPADTGDPVVDDVPGTTVPSGEVGGVRPSPAQARPGELLPEAEDQSESLSPWLLPLVVVAFLGVWTLVFGVLIVAAKRRRRHRRRRAPTPSERIMGAWVDSGDRLVETGVGVYPQLTFTETIEAGGVRLGDETVVALRNMLPDVGACAYSDEPPDGEAADRAWELADVFRTDLGTSRSLVRSAVAGLNPRPLLRSRGR